MEISKNLQDKLGLVMTDNNTPTDTKKVPATISQFLTSRASSISELLGKDGSIRFISAVTAAVGATPALQNCDVVSIYSGALLGESLKLAHSPQLGQYYLVPFNDKNGGKPKAQFILGVKGWKQLAIRTGQYRVIDVVNVHKGEYLGRNPETAEPMFKFIADDEKRDKLPVVGYMAYFRMLNGFEKRIFVTKTEMLKHADTYSQAFSWKGVNTDKMKKVSYEDYLAGKYPKADEWKYSSFWYKDFDGMARGKVLKRLLSEWGAVSIEMQKAIDVDDKVVYEENGEVVYDTITDYNDKQDKKAVDGVFENADTVEAEVVADENGVVVENVPTDEFDDLFGGNK